jgi:hypothetical protein
MQENNPQPDVEAIIQELREGMADIESSHPSDPEAAVRRELRASLRKATETADVLGRCGGSLRGKLCKLLAFIVFPVVEQLNMHHVAVVAALPRFRDTRSQDAPGSNEALEARIQKLEDAIASIHERNSP